MEITFLLITQVRTLHKSCHGLCIRELFTINSDYKSGTQEEIKGTSQSMVQDCCGRRKKR